MTLHLNLPADIELAARALARARGENVEAFLMQQLAVTLQNQSRKNAIPQQDIHHRHFLDTLEKWAGMHPTPDSVDDSRESIYTDR